MTAEFDELGFKFLYPDNWTLERDPDDDWPRSVSVHGPTGAFWSVTEDRDLEAEELLDQIVGALRQEYEEVETHRVDRMIGTLRMRGVELYFYCLDALVIAQVAWCEGLHRRMVMMYQAENRDFESLATVFDAISFSLVSNLKPGST